MAFLLNPLHYALHHALRWDFATTFEFARNDDYVAIARSEARILAQQAPVLVVISGKKAIPAVPLNPRYTRHRLLDERHGWTRGPAPTALRYHPFRTIADSNTGAPMLAVAEDRDTVRPDATNGFFDDMAQPLPIVRAVLRRLQQLQLEKTQTQAAAVALAEAGVLSVVPHMVDRLGRTPFHTLDDAAFARLPGSRLASLGPQPHHAFMLASAMAHSRHWLAADLAIVDLPQPETTADRPPPGSFAMQDEDFVLNFD